MPNTSSSNYFNLTDPLDYYTQAQETTIIRPNLSQQHEKIILQPSVAELNPILPSNSPINMGDLQATTQQ